jgi:hypothetical protein
MIGANGHAGLKILPRGFDGGWAGCLGVAGHLPLPSLEVSVAEHLLHVGCAERSIGLAHPIQGVNSFAPAFGQISRLPIAE